MNVGLIYTPDGAGLQYSWANYHLPDGYAFCGAVLNYAESLQGQYWGIVTSRWNSYSRDISLYINFRWSGAWETQITVAKVVDQQI